ncbi:GIY-YIG nuclease family protein [Vibrio europaeus]|uniref:GIY-YIG nuclease family protein n=2 Tax=Vibrio europaeus TaxID=300876 RepID=UPI00148B5BCE|nr:GIY-YIG nuclease family protein [Vibrio europaeus]NOH23858.1 GIY-YIG nuclease family protein [Vibrio europaeus]
MCEQDLFNNEGKVPSLGYVYIMSNEAFPHLLKIGFTDRKPETRAKELSSTGSPYPFIVEFSVLCENPYLKEQAIHAELAEHRETNNREFFNISLNDAKHMAITHCLSEDFIDAVSDYYELELEFTVQDLREELAKKKELNHQYKQTIEKNIQEAEDEWIAIANERDEAKKMASDCVAGNFKLQDDLRLAKKMARIVTREHCRVLGVESLSNDFFMGKPSALHRLRVKVAAEHVEPNDGLLARLKKLFFA